MIRRKIKIHHPIMKERRYAGNFYLFCDMLVDELKKHYEVEEYRYYEEIKNPPVYVKLQSITREDFFLHDSDILIENEHNEFVLFTATDILHPSFLMEKYNPKLKKIFISQFYPHNIKTNVKDDAIYLEKYSPWIYFPSSTINLEQFYHKRKYTEDGELLDKMIFRGGVDHRKIVTYISKDVLSDTNFLKYEWQYYEDAIRYKIGLSVGGRGEICYRDIEYMAMGIPFLRFQYQSRLLPDLIPNFHYIAVDMPSDMPVDLHRDGMPDDTRGTEKHAELLVNKFFEVKDDKPFLEFIARNARIYYETYLAPGKNVQYTIRLIKENLGL